MFSEKLFNDQRRATLPSFWIRIIYLLTYIIPVRVKVSENALIYFHCSRFIWQNFICNEALPNRSNEKWVDSYSIVIVTFDTNYADPNFKKHHLRGYLHRGLRP